MSLKSITHQIPLSSPCVILYNTVPIFWLPLFLSFFVFSKYFPLAWHHLATRTLGWNATFSKDSLVSFLFFYTKRFHTLSTSYSRNQCLTFKIVDLSLSSDITSFFNNNTLSTRWQYDGWLVGWLVFMVYQPKQVSFDLVLWHINHCWLMPNLVYTCTLNICIICKYFF